MTERRCVCPGSFDPVTNGHLDVSSGPAGSTTRSPSRCSSTPRKSGLFEVAGAHRDAPGGHRRRWATSGSTPSRGCSSTTAGSADIPVVVKGLRAVSDFDYELQMAQMNHRLTGIETLFVATNPEYSFLSSSLVKEVATWGGDVAGLVPDAVLARLRARLDPDLTTAARRPTPPEERRPWTCTTSSTSSSRRRERPLHADVGLLHHQPGRGARPARGGPGRSCRRSSGTPSCCSPTASRSSTRAGARPPGSSAGPRRSGWR